MLAYGQTGSGKTYTMGTSKIVGSSVADERSLGIIPRVIEHLFSEMEERSEQYSYSTRVSFLEIYNEELKDLLTSNAAAVSSSATASSQNQLAIREEQSGIKVHCSVLPKPTCQGHQSNNVHTFTGSYIILLCWVDNGYD